MVRNLCGTFVRKDDKPSSSNTHGDAEKFSAPARCKKYWSTA
jgi:hypothetical protein